MSLIRKVEIENFRSIRKFVWYPQEGINCIIGSGDSGKSTILDAIDYCIGAKRNLRLNDSDFYKLDIENPISITITLTNLEDSLKNIDSYGLYLRSFDPKTGEIDDEPKAGFETAITINLTVTSDLEPVWTLVSDSATAQGLSRFLIWSDRLALSPTRIGEMKDGNFNWKRGSILNKISDETVDASSEIINAARAAKQSFGDKADKQLPLALNAIQETADQLGVPTGGGVHALLEALSISVSGGAIALHDEFGVPLRNLGIGSTRLLLAGLQRKQSSSTSCIIMDEIEYGLEPHRIIRLLTVLGSKQEPSPIQAFITTHSPIVLRELNAEQLYVLRKTDDEHTCICIASKEGTQGTIRAYAEAFLAKKVIACEGASEVGLLRGLDIYFSTTGKSNSLYSFGTFMIDVKGFTNLVSKARAFNSLQYETLIFRDDDIRVKGKLKPEELNTFNTSSAEYLAEGGNTIFWSNNWTIEDALFESAPDDVVIQLLEYAKNIHGEELIDSHIRSVSANNFTLANIVAHVTPETRNILSKCAQLKQSWFKNITSFQEIGINIIGPNYDRFTYNFKSTINEISKWALKN